MIVIAVVAAGIGYWKLTGEESDTLRKIVLYGMFAQSAAKSKSFAMCGSQTNAGYVVLKDLNGPLQYLLMPTYRINGTESPLLTDPSTPNFWLAWQARDFMSKIRPAGSRSRGFFGDQLLHRAYAKTIFIFISSLYSS